MAFVTQMLLDNGTIRAPRSGRKSYRVRHCPGLYLQVTSNGVMSWALMLRVNGKQRHKTLGRLGNIPRLDAAVDVARIAQEKARRGIDPFAPETETPGHTLGAAVERYLKEYVELNCRAGTIYNYRRVFTHDVLPLWGDRPLNSITKADILELVNDKAAAPRERVRKDRAGAALVQANRTLARLSAFFKWCLANDLLAVDPTAGVRNVARERPRDRFLTDAEMVAFWRATGDGSAWSTLFRLALLTAQRRSEVGGMRSSEIDLENRTWTIPAARAKNNKSHVVHLSALALAQLARRPRERDRVFQGTSFSRAKARIDARMGPVEKPWVVHDLRRTATTIMAQIGVPPHVADRVLNHQSGTIRGVAATYNRFEYIDERKDALERLGEHVAKLVGENIVEMPKRA